MNKVKILFVEDDAPIRRELSPFLARFCLGELLVGVDGKEGLELYKEHRPDIVVSDIKMPKMNGIDMVKAIKEIDPNQSVVFTSAHSNSSYFLEAIELQVDGYMLKPVILKLLKKKLTAIIEHIMLKRNYDLQRIIVNEVAQLHANMLAVINKDREPLFVNDKWLHFVGVESLEMLKKKGMCISDKFLQEEGYFYPSNDDVCIWVDELREKKPDERKVIVGSGDSLDKSAYIISLTDIEDTQHTVISFFEVTQIEQEKSAYKLQAYTDELTGIGNRALFNEELKSTIIESKNQRLSFSLILFDLDYFKNINDTYGHLVGDEVLIDISRFVKNKLRDSDIFARWGGEEFIILLPKSDIKIAERVAENLRSMIENHIFADEIKITSSFGVAEFQALDTPESILNRVDKALYRAKNGGRNRVDF